MGRILTLAMVDPLDTEALEEIKKYCPNLRIKPVLCSWEHFQTTIKQVYSHEVSKPENLEEKYDSPDEYSDSSQIADETIDKSAVVAPEDAPTFDDVSITSKSGDAFQSSTSSEDVHDEKTPSQSATLSFSGIEGLSGVIRDSVRDVLGDMAELSRSRSSEDAVSIAQTVRQVLEVIADRNETERKRDVEVLANAVRESIAAVISSTQDARSLQTSDIEKIADATVTQVSGGTILEEETSGTRQMDVSPDPNDLDCLSKQQEQLAQIAEAAMASVQQTAQFIEAHTVAKNAKDDLLRHRKARHISVTPFLAAEGPADGELHVEEDNRVREALTSEHPLETLTFENFFGGEANKFTVKLAEAVAENPGSKYNPFFIYGKVGLGKTHLISAIGNASMVPEKSNRLKRVGYISASHFARRLLDALEDNALELFRDNYCHWDMLILDDIQFLGGHIEAQEEFFHIFNVLQQQGRQIVIASDKAPDRLGMLEQRLVSRFASGIVVDLKPPEWETRMTILRYLVKQEGGNVSDEILSMIATRVADDIRKMTGALRKIIAFSRLEEDKISVEDAQRILIHLGADEAA